MSKLRKKVNSGENRCSSLHRNMNMAIGPTRLEALGNIPSYVIPDVDPMQRQLNSLENRVSYEEQLSRRRAWKRK